MQRRPLSSRLPSWLHRGLKRVPGIVPLYRAARIVHVRERMALLLLAASAVLIGFASVRFSTFWISPSMLILVLLVGGLQLRLRSLAVLLTLVAVVLVVLFAAGAAEPGLIVATVLIAVMSVLLARTRTKTGVRGLRGDGMLVELRDVLKARGRLPPLPKGWDQTAVLKYAGGSTFGGDFLVAARTGETCYQMTLVDVSGKGVDAGTRALMLSGAFGGLLGSVDSGDFLTKCNNYLNRQHDQVGLVTAAHLSLNLESGEYTITSAGHPPPVKFDSATGVWQVSAARGIALGVTADLRCEPDTGVLRRGDALMLYTDGMVERPGRDIDAGIDRLLGEAEGLVTTTGFAQGAARLTRKLALGRTDDCALVVIWRA
ncbi:PP2C family protein-serine/threonine phosphatase [Rhizohabitans arisaemae]|uniref:PP2C family protein-serine/threonine phosphatase n=1 Tax=Rhizohabitans arisaemae TaxID=2720610 RepID=UPI0024B0CB92|nr:PP2C family protein-serine/threonine phosphatase [Rhizohabitans arisaemae]